MALQNKDINRTLARAESLRVAISESFAPESWGRTDLEHMAGAASLLWEQADALAIKFPDHKDELSEALCRVFEPLLLWAGEFCLVGKVAESRRRRPTFKAPHWEAGVVEFEALALQNKFCDNYAKQRLESLTKARGLFASMAAEVHSASPEAIGRVAFGWHLFGLDQEAKDMLGKSPSIKQSCDYFLKSKAPKYWRLGHYNKFWMDIVSGISKQAD